MIKNVYLSSSNVLDILEPFSNTQVSNFMKIRPVGAEFFHADRRMDKNEVIYLSI